MGYYTYYEIGVKELDGTPVPAEKTTIMATTLCDINPDEFEGMVLIDPSLTNMVGCDARKWYEFENDMLKLSRVFSDKQFIITGWGEDRSDVWRMKITNGKSITSQGQIWFPDFDEVL